MIVMNKKVFDLSGIIDILGLAKVPRPNIDLNVTERTRQF
jgi:hypothetical protein